MHSIDIAEVAKRSGLAPSALRFYETKGLIAPAGRRGLRRVYASDVLERLALIALWREAGFALDDIVLMFASKGGFGIDRKAIETKVEQLEKTIARFSEARDSLRHAVACPAPSLMECPKFRLHLEAVLSRDPPPANRSLRQRGRV